jgi:hypothetical protein
MLLVYPEFSSFIINDYSKLGHIVLHDTSMYFSGGATASGSSFGGASVSKTEISF